MDAEDFFLSDDLEEANRNEAADYADEGPNEVLTGAELLDVLTDEAQADGEYGVHPDIIVTIPSRGRAENVPVMQQLIGPSFRVVWVVPPEDEQAYRAAGAAEVITAVGLCRARNVALDFCFDVGKACLQTDDDLKLFHALPPNGDVKQRPKLELTFRQAVLEMDRALDETGLTMCGCSTTNNLFFAKLGVSTHKFIIASFMLVRPTDLRFDEEFKTKEDYDYTLQHWEWEGGAARCDWIAPSYAHYSNKGGVVDFRNDEVEQASIARLMEKWPGLVRLNPKRDNEVLLKTLRGSAA